MRNLLRGLPRPLRRGHEDFRRAGSAAHPGRSRELSSEKSKEQHERNLLADRRQGSRRNGGHDHPGGGPECGDLHSDRSATTRSWSRSAAAGSASVEVEARGRTSLVAACVYPVEQDLVVRTRSEKIDRIRKMLLEQLLAHAPDSDGLQELGRGVRRRQGPFRRKSPRSASSAACACATAPRSRRRTPSASSTGAPEGDQLHSGDRRQGVLGLQGVLPALPDLVSAGGLRPGRSPRVSIGFCKTSVRDGLKKENAMAERAQAGPFPA